MILSWLTAEFNDLFTKNPAVRVLLWFDAKEEHARLLDVGGFPSQGTDFTLLRYRLDDKAGVYHGPLWIKAHIAWDRRMTH